MIILDTTRKTINILDIYIYFSRYFSVPRTLRYFLVRYGPSGMELQQNFFFYFYYKGLKIRLKFTSLAVTEAHNL